MEATLNPFTPVILQQEVTPVIETVNVSKIYRTGALEVRAVDNVTVQINPGEFVGLVGPSGSGKTTMLAMLAALLTPSEGKVYIDGYDLGEMSDSDRVRFRREKIGFTFQSNNLVPYLNVRENVELMLRLNGGMSRERTDQVDDLLIRLGMKDRMKNMPSELSGGQRQRVAIARSLIHRPSVVLADEPTASLDTERAYQVVQLYADLIHEQQRAGIMVTHDLRMCMHVDKIIQIHDGKVDSVLVGRDEIEAYIACG